MAYDTPFILLYLVLDMCICISAGGPSHAGAAAKSDDKRHQYQDDTEIAVSPLTINPSKAA